MKLSPAPIQITDTEGFDNNDIFNRKPFADKLTEIIKNCDDELVIAIDSPWGTGKTTFVEMWQGMLQNEPHNIKSIYFDAFKNDYLDDPFLALVGEVYQKIDDHNTDEAKEFKEKAISAMKILGKASISVALKALVSAGVDDTVLEGEGTGSDFAAISDNYIADRIKAIKKDKISLTKFHDALVEVAKSIGGNNKLIFIIDELDRCKPSFALDLLEKIKHLFSIPSIVFVLVMNREQINEVIKLRYGNGIKADLYLQKFVHLWAGLPQLKNPEESNGKVYLKDCMIRMDYLPSSSQEDEAKFLFEELIEYYSLSFRDIERCLSNFSILVNLGFMPRNNSPEIGAYLSIIKTIYPPIVKKLAMGKCSYDHLVSQTNLDGLTDHYWGSEKPESHKLKWLLRAYLIKDSEEYKLYVKEFNSGRLQIRQTADIIQKICIAFETFSDS